MLGGCVPHPEHSWLVQHPLHPREPQEVPRTPEGVDAFKILDEYLNVDDRRPHPAIFFRTTGVKMAAKQWEDATAGLMVSIEHSPVVFGGKKAHMLGH